MNQKFIAPMAGFALILGSVSAFGEESQNHVGQALIHAEAAAAASDAAGIAEHAAMSKTHAGVADEHLDAGLKSLDSAIEHGKLGHTDLAKKAAEEAVTHLKAAQ